MCVYVVLLMSVWSADSSFVYGQQNEETVQATHEISSTIQRKTTKPDYREVSYDVTVKDVNLLIARENKIFLWGIEKINPDMAVFNLKARSALEKEIGGKSIVCTTQARKGNVISAQCINYVEEDLSLFLLQKGYVTADRSAVHGSIYEEPYLEAEALAYARGYGIWVAGERYSSSGDKQTKSFMFGAFFLVAVFIIALIVLGYFIMRGFGRVIDVQNRSLDLAIRERFLKEKEKLVIASMIHSEVKENKSKIEAYLVVYEEMLRELSDETKSLAYQKTGEVIQKQPASMSRVVFDGNTDKLDLFGGELASNLVHYYARIKTNPDYIEIAPDVPVKEVQNIIFTAVENAKKIDDISIALLEKISNHEILKEEGIDVRMSSPSPDSSLSPDSSPSPDSSLSPDSSSSFRLE